jgi:hypothetical protein
MIFITPSSKILWIPKSKIFTNGWLRYHNSQVEIGVKWTNIQFMRLQINFNVYDPIPKNSMGSLLDEITKAW